MMRALRFMAEGFVLRRLSDFATDRRGVSAVEFALLLPLMLTLYLGGVELSQGISIDRKVTLTARTPDDLLAAFAAYEPPSLPKWVERTDV